MSSPKFDPEALNKATDDLNEAFKSAATALRALRLGVTGSVALRYEGNGNSKRDWTEFLVFGKRDGEWGLYVETAYDDDPDSLQWQPLVNASRETRLLAARKLPELHLALVRAAESQIKEVRERTQQVYAFVASISGNQPAGRGL